MLAKGFAATTVEDICDASKLTKGSFFHYFDSKEALGKAVLERFCSGRKRHLGEAVCTVADDPIERIDAQIDCAIKLSKDPDAVRGCLLGTFAQELADTNAAIRSLCARQFGEWTTALQQDLRAAKARYAPKASFEPRTLAEHFIAVLEGALILSKVKQDSKVVETSLEHYRRYLHGLLGQ